MDVRLPDGTVIQGVPDGTSKADLTAKLKTNGYDTSSWEPQTPNPVLETIKNIPGSALRFAGGIGHAVMHPVDTASGAFDALAGGLRNITPEPIRNALDVIDPNQQAGLRATQTADAIGQFYKNRYGGLENVKNTVITDPVGFAGDVSAVLGAGSGLAKLAGTGLGAFRATAAAAPALQGAANVLGTASAYTNPLSVVVPAAKAVGQVGKYALGLTTGVGPENVAQAAKSGYAGDSAFINNLSGKSDMTDVLQQAKEGLQNMRETRTGLYKSQIATTAADTTKLDFGPIDQKLADVVDSLKEGKHWTIGKSELGDIKKLQSTVAEWRIDEAAHTPIGLDALKRRLDALYPSSADNTQAQRAITSVRNAVKDTIVEQSPQYAETMANYESALGVEKEIQRALSLGTKASQDTAIRKLQSLSRNNVSTNYGNRLGLAQTLEDQGGVSLLPSIAGQAMNSWTARGLAGQAENLGTLGVAALHNPLALSTLPLQSPKAVGATLYGLGSLARLGNSGANALGLTADQIRYGGLLASQLGNLPVEGQR
jgi:hypothetical protein